MQKSNRQADFFMGCNSPDGFYSLYGDLQKPLPGVRRFLIKGGAGTGKSSLMRRAAAEFQGRDALTERIHCSSDPQSLDGVILHTGRVSLVDATPPHVIEPTYPGGFESVINLLDYFDEEKLEQRLERTVALQTANAECHRKCRGLLKCADILLRDNACYVESCTDFAKIDALAARLCRAELKPTGKTGGERRRLLSAVTNQGIVTYEETANALCSRIVLLRDEYGAAAPALLRRIREDALQKGYELFGCYCPFAPDSRLEHLFLPEIGLGFVTQSRFCEFRTVKPWKVINATRFTDQQGLRRRKQYLSFNRKAAKELIGAAVDCLRQAKSLHDELEKQYTDAVNFAGVTQKTEEVLARIARRYDSVSDGSLF